MTVTYENAEIPGRLWEAENIQTVFEVFDFSVEHVGTVESVRPFHAKFLLGTTEYADIVHFLDSILMIEEAGRVDMGFEVQGRNR